MHARMFFEFIALLLMTGETRFGQFSFQFQIQWGMGIAMT
jgi:hypothetical protein